MGPSPGFQANSQIAPIDTIKSLPYDKIFGRLARGAIRHDFPEVFCIHLASVDATVFVEPRWLHSRMTSREVPKEKKSRNSFMDSYSPWAIAGITIGSLAVAAGIAVLIWYFLFRTRVTPSGTFQCATAPRTATGSATVGAGGQYQQCIQTQSPTPSGFPTLAACQASCQSVSPTPIDTGTYWITYTPTGATPLYVEPDQTTGLLQLRQAPTASSQNWAYDSGQQTLSFAGQYLTVDSSHRPVMTVQSTDLVKGWILTRDNGGQVFWSVGPQGFNCLQGTAGPNANLIMGPCFSGTTGAGFMFLSGGFFSCSPVS